MRSLLAVPLLALTLLAGCGDDSDDPTSISSDPTSTSTSPAAEQTEEAPDPDAGKTEAAARKAVETHFANFFSGKFEAACAGMTKEYAKDQIEESGTFGKAVDNCPDALKAAVAYAEGFGFTEDTLTMTTTKVTGDKATVLGESDPPFEDTTYELLWNGSRWLIAGEQGDS